MEYIYLLIALPLIAMFLMRSRTHAPTRADRNDRWIRTVGKRPPTMFEPHPVVHADLRPVMRAIPERKPVVEPVEALRRPAWPRLRMWLKQVPLKFVRHGDLTLCVGDFGHQGKCFVPVLANGQFDSETPCLWQHDRLWSAKPKASVWRDQDYGGSDRRQWLREMDAIPPLLQLPKPPIYLPPWEVMERLRP